MALRSWRALAGTDSTLANRIQRAAFVLTVVVAVAIGAASLGLALIEIPAKEREQHLSTLRLINARLESSVGNALRTLEALSRSPLVWTALTDSAGRDAYLKPFLVDRDADNASGDLLLLDYRGRPVASRGTPAITDQQFQEVVAVVLKDKQPTFALRNGEPVLLAAYPVIFPLTGDAIGVLIQSFNLNKFLSDELRGLDPGLGIALLAEGRLLDRFPSTEQGRHFPVNVPVILPGDAPVPALSLELYSLRHRWFLPLLSRVLVYLLIGAACATLVWRIAGRMAVTLTRRLDRLAVACASVATGRPFSAPEDAVGDEIGLLSRTLRQALLAHEEIQANLQQLVDQKTDALNESMERYRQAFEINTAVKFIIDPSDGRIVEANDAACRFYGYSREKLLSMRITEIDTLPERAVKAEMAQAVATERLYHNFKHRLASGEIRDVEVYSGPIMIGGIPHLHSIVHDITERRKAEAALRNAEKKYRSVVESVREVVFQADQNGRWTYLNPAWEEVTGFAPQDCIGRLFLDYVHPDDLARAQELLETVVHSRQDDRRYEIRIQHREGSFRWVEILVRLTLDDSNQVIGFSGTLADISERRAADARLRLAASVFQHSHEGIILTDETSRIIEVNEAFSRITGYSREEVLGRMPNLLKSGHQGEEFYHRMWQDLRESGFWQGEVWNRRKSGEVYPELLTISAVKDGLGNVSHYVGVFADISPIKLHEQQLERIAHYDALTQLPNRILLADRMRLALAQARRSGALVAICYLDLDGFKAVNDEHGHAAGDKLLVEISHRLSKTLRAEDTVARLGGDEFALIMQGLGSAEECEEVLQRIIRTVGEPVFLGDGEPTSVSASIGVALYPAADEDADALLRHADQAMYEAKQLGKNRYQLFNPEQDRRVRSYRARLQELRQALTAEQLLLYYQPKVNLRNGQVVGVEALLRWHHPAQGLLLPGAFLVDLNNAEMECMIDRWVLEAAAAQAESWHNQGKRLPISVNISAAYLESEDFVPWIRNLLAAHPGAQDLIELEVLESAALDDMDRVAAIILECKGMGVPFALDDFGTGYSSLTYFRRLPADVLKIDMSFVRDMLEDADDMAIVEGIIGLTRAFGRKVVAEGVETHAHGQALLEMGCEIAQGFGIARPMPAADVLQWVADWRPMHLSLAAEQAASV